MKCCIDSVNIWEVLSALGTIGASGIALWLACDERRKKISATFVWDEGTGYAPILIICNSGPKIITIKSIDFVYGHQFYEGVDLSKDCNYRDYRILHSNSTVNIPMSLPENLYTDLENIEKKNTNGIEFQKYIRLSKRQRKFKVIVTDINDKKYKIKLAYSQRELLENFFGHKLLNN